MAANLSLLPAEVAEDVEVEVIGAWGDVRHGSLRARLASQIDAADALLCVVHEPNANAAFELGYAIARGKAVAIAAEGQERPAWLTRPPFQGVLVEPGAASLKRLAGLARTVGDWEPYPTPAPGRRTLLLTPPGGYGDAWRRVARGALGEGLDMLPWEGFSLEDLRRLFWGAGRAAWVVPAATKEDLRHGEGVTAAALLAGYALGLGLPVGIFCSERATPPADVEGQIRRFEGDGLRAALLAWREETEGGLEEPPIELLVQRYREALREVHGHLVPLARGGARPVLEEIFVEPDLCAAEGGLHRGGIERMRGRTTLETLLREDAALDAGRGHAPRWVLRGEPGAGKTTLVRHLAWGLAGSRSQPLPIFLSLSRLVGRRDGPEGAPRWGELLAAVEDQLRPRLGNLAPGALVAKFQAWLEDGRPAWLLLDGLDEVHPDFLAATVDWLEDLAGQPIWRDVPILVTTRPVVAGAARLPATPGPVADLRGLDEAQQAELVDRLAGAGSALASEVKAAVAGSASLSGLAKNPLMLTLLVETSRGRGGDGRPANRSELLERAVGLLLERGYRPPEAGVPAAGVRSPAAMRPLLEALSVVLHRGDEDKWAREAVVDAMTGILAGPVWVGAEASEDEAAPMVVGLPVVRPGWFVRLVSWLAGLAGLRVVKDPVGPSPPAPAEAPLLTLPAAARKAAGEWWGGRGTGDQPVATEAVNDLLDQGGVVGQHDGEGEPCRYLHRALREHLAAAGLAMVPAAAVPRVLAGDGSEAWLARWAEVAAVRASRLPPAEAEATLRALGQVAPDVAVRALKVVEGLEPAVWLSLMVGVDSGKPWDRGWDNDDLDQVIDAIAARPGAAEALWRGLPGSADRFTQGAWLYALERVGAWPEADRPAMLRRFWEGVGLDPDGPSSPLPRVEVAGGRLAFWMGSPEGVGEGWERPRHRVTLSRPFALGSTPVTNGQYAAFDVRARDRPVEEPAVELSWFEARMYAAWAGGRLPSEAEWECACRADTDTAWSFGDGEAALGEHACFGGNSGSKLHAVGQKRPNPWGLFDMHGLVWEWTEDRWRRPYGAEPEGDPVGPARGGGRLIRGGSFRNAADGSRSAFRSGVLPGDRCDFLGFRVCFPPPSGV